MNQNNTPLTSAEWDKWTELTKRVRFENGRIPLDAFYAWCGSFYTVAVELFGYRFKESGPEILLTYRKDNYYDGYYVAGVVHVPGRTIEETKEHLLKSEFPGIKEVGQWEWMEVTDIQKGEGPDQDLRGQDVKLLYGAKMDGEIPDGKWFPIHELPENILPEFHSVLKRVVPWIEARQN